MKCRKKQPILEAFRWTGGPDQTEDPEWIIQALENGQASFGENCLVLGSGDEEMRVSPGDYIVKGDDGYIYHVPSYSFYGAYEVVE